MIKHKLPVLGLGLLLLITSCKKTDLEATSAPTPEATSVGVTAPAASIKVSEWTTLNNWSSSKNDKFSTYNSSVADSSITNSVTSNGLVLAFMKNGTTIKALPFQETETKGAFWYYQVSNGSIILSCDDYSGNKSLNTSEFKYYVFTPEQLNDLQSKGYSKVKLMQLGYEEVAALASK